MFVSLFYKLTIVKLKGTNKLLKTKNDIFGAQTFGTFFELDAQTRCFYDEITAPYIKNIPHIIFYVGKVCCSWFPEHNWQLITIDLANNVWHGKVPKKVASLIGGC